MNKKILIVFMLLLLSSCSYISTHQDGKDRDKKTSVCDAHTAICGEPVAEDVFSYANLESSGSIFNKNYPAPELIGLENWINSDGYSSLDELKGQVVLVDFWTLGCINCIRTLPHLVETYEAYADQGFEILALHSPEFAYEQKLEAVQRAVDKYELPYPVAQDNDFSTWKAYKNRYWPAHYLIDKAGNVRYTHFGEGKYDEMNQAIEELLAE